jgi:hypothetical protein
MFSKIAVTTRSRRIVSLESHLWKKKTEKIGHIRLLIATALGLMAMLAIADYVRAVATPPLIISTVGAHASQLNEPGAEYAIAIPQEFRQQLSVSAANYSSYMRVAHDSDAISMDVPTEWKDIETGKWTYRGRDVGWFIAASGNLDAFRSTRSEPGIFIGVSRVLAQMRDEQGVMTFEQGSFAQRCQRQGRYAYKDLFYGGQYDLYASCIAGGRNRMVVVALPANRQFLILLRVTVVSEADLQAATRIFQTFQVVGDPDDHSHDEH